MKATQRCSRCRERQAEQGTHCFPCLVGDDEIPSRVRYKVDVPEGTSGAWSVKRFEVSARDAESNKLRAINPSTMGRFVPQGTYTALYRGGAIIMSDTPDEIRDHIYFMRSCRGRVLIAGLGLGMCTRGVLGNPKVDHVTVIEQSPDVIRLVGPAFADSDRITIVEGDIFTWKPAKGEKFDFGWFDVWDNLCADNVDEMAKLNRRFARSVAEKHHWGRYECLRAKRHQGGW